MTSVGNASAEQSEKKVEGEDRLKTLECLRGRLLAERGASKAANEEADKLGNKLIQLENKLKEEVKWRNKAEKRLKSLIQKLESKNIVYVISDDSSDHSSSFEKSDLSSISSSSTSSFSYPSKQPQDNDNKQFNSQLKNSEKNELDEPVEEIDPTLPKHTTSSERHIFSQIQKIKSDKTISQRSDNSQCSENNTEAKNHDHRSEFSVDEKGINGENDENWDERNVDNSMALVVVTTQSATPTTTTIEPLIANNAEVKDVLDILSFLKERLQTSMGVRHMVKVGF